MSEDFFKPTQQLLEGLISTPSMSEKLLLRPPFRFIHDIITSLSKQYSPEGYFFNVNDEISEDLREGDKIDGKEMKLKYLIELFKVVEKWSGRTIDADPKKVASGKECEKTNIFLQIVGSIVLDRKRTKMHASIPGEISSSDVTPSTAPPAATPPSTAPPAATPPSTPSSKKRSPSPQKTSQNIRGQNKLDMNTLAKNPVLAENRKKIIKLFDDFSGRISNFGFKTSPEDLPSSQIFKNVSLMEEELKKKKNDEIGENSKLPEEALSKAIARQIEAIQQVRDMLDEGDAITTKMIEYLV